MKCGIIDTGGGFRGIFGAGVVDRLIDDAINFDLAIGVSAGSANLAYYLAGQRGKIKRYYTEFSLRPEYASLHNYVHQRSFLNLDYIYGTLPNKNGEEPLNYPALMANPCPYLVVACNANTGLAHYFSKDDIKQNHYDAMKASSCLPVYDRPYYINDVPYFDGGIVDPIPIDKALAAGCDKIVITLTRPENFRRTYQKDLADAMLLRSHYPQTARTLTSHYAIYNDCLNRAQQLSQQGRVLILAPDSLNGLSTLTRDIPKLEAFYQKGYEAAKAVKAFLQA